MPNWAYAAEQEERKFLVIEDEPDIAELIALHLADINGKVTTIHDGTEGLNAARTNQWDAIILDLRLPGMDGIDICRQLRNESCHTPIIMLTARSTELDRVLGLEIGADDYLTKPFSALELQARVKAVIRRSQHNTEQANNTSAPHPIISFGELTIKKSERIASLNNNILQLTATEFDLLCFFAENPSTVFSRSDLLDKVWNYQHQGYEHTVNSHINRLRSKLESDPANPSYIHTIWGVGYRFSAPEAIDTNNN